MTRLALFDLDQRLRIVEQFENYTQVLSHGLPPVERLFPADKSPEMARTASEESRGATDAERQGMVDAMRATADALNASLEQMKVVEELRRTLREIRDVNTLDSN